MKKIFMILVCGILLIGLTGCDKNPKANQEKKDDYSSYVGTYKNNFGQILTITQSEDGKLYIENNLINLNNKNSDGSIRLYKWEEQTEQSMHIQAYDLYDIGIDLNYLGLSSPEQKTDKSKIRLLLFDNYVSEIDINAIYYKLDENEEKTLSLGDYKGQKLEDVKKQLGNKGLTVKVYSIGIYQNIYLNEFKASGYTYEDKNIIYQYPAKYDTVKEGDTVFLEVYSNKADVDVFISKDEPFPEIARNLMLYYQGYLFPFKSDPPPMFILWDDIYDSYQKEGNESEYFNLYLRYEDSNIKFGTYVARLSLDISTCYSCQTTLVQIISNFGFDYIDRDLYGSGVEAANEYYEDIKPGTFSMLLAYNGTYDVMIRK